jgi:deferrochelatase/peroxidase EfeB
MTEWPPFDPTISDGCTGVRDFGVRHCCVAHDRDYWYGRTSQDRAAADRELRWCIQAEGGAFYWCLGWVRWVGVRLLGRRAFWGKPHKQGDIA